MKEKTKYLLNLIGNAFVFIFLAAAIVGFVYLAYELLTPLSVPKVIKQTESWTMTDPQGREWKIVKNE